MWRFLRKFLAGPVRDMVASISADSALTRLEDVSKVLNDSEFTDLIAAIRRATVRSAAVQRTARASILSELERTVIRPYGITDDVVKLPAEAETAAKQAFRKIRVGLGEAYGLYVPELEEYTGPRFPDPAKVLVKIGELGGGDLDVGRRKLAELWAQQVGRPGISAEELAGTLDNITAHYIRGLLREPKSVYIGEEVLQRVLPMAWFVHHRTSVPVPDELLMPFNKAVSVYAEQAADWASIRWAEAMLHSYIHKVPIEEALRVLAETDRAILSSGGDLKVGQYLLDMTSYLLQKYGKDPRKRRILSEALDAMESVMTRDLGFVRRFFAVDAVKTMVPWLSGIMAGLGNVMQLVNSIALFNRGFKMFADMADFAANRKQYADAARALGTAAAFWAEDAIGRGITWAELEAAKKVGIPVPWATQALALSRSWADRVMKVSGLEKVEAGLLRVADPLMAYKFMKEGGKGLEVAKKLLDISDDEIKAAIKWWEDATRGIYRWDPQAQSVFHILTSYTQFTYKGYEFPTLVNRSQLAEGLLQFMKFSYLQSTRTVKHAIDRAMAGDPVPLLTLLALGSPLMYSAEMARGFFTGTNWRFIHDSSTGQVHVFGVMDTGDPENKKGLYRRMNAMSPFLSTLLEAVLNSGVLGMLGEFMDAGLKGDPMSLRLSTSPVIANHMLRWLEVTGEVLGNFFRGDFVGAAKETFREVARSAGPVAVTGVLERTGLLGKLGEVGIPTLLAVLPRTISQAWLELRPDDEILKTLRKTTVKYFLNGNPEWVELQKYIIARFGPDAAITRRDILRTMKTRLIAEMGLTRKELDEATDEELDKILMERVRNL